MRVGESCVMANMSTYANTLSFGDALVVFPSEGARKANCAAVAGRTSRSLAGPGVAVLRLYLHTTEPPSLGPSVLCLSQLWCIFGVTMAAAALESTACKGSTLQ